MGRTMLGLAPSPAQPVQTTASVVAQDGDGAPNAFAVVAPPTALNPALPKGEAPLAFGGPS